MAASLLFRLLWCEPVLWIQVFEASVIALIMGIFFPRLAASLTRLFRTRPWYDYHIQLLKGQAGVRKEELDEAAAKRSEEAAARHMGNFVVITAQHITGGLFALPAVFGFGLSPQAISAMTRHSALIELGWEVQDVVHRVWERLTHPDGAVLQSNATLKFFIVHHISQWVMAIPLNLYWSDLAPYAEFIVLLQVAAGGQMTAQFLTGCCDISKRHELRQMVIWCAVSFTILFYTRVVHYPWTVFKLLSALYAAGAYVEFVAGFLVGVFAMPYVAYKIVPHDWKKLRKHWRLYRDGGSEQKKPEELTATPLTGNGAAKEHNE